VKQAIGALLLGCSFILGCSKGSSSSSGSCTPAVGKSCWNIVKGSRFEIPYVAAKPGEEYILTVQSLEDVQDNETYGPRTIQTTADSSDRPSNAETQLKSEVLSEIRKRPLLPDFESPLETPASTNGLETQAFEAESFHLHSNNEIFSHNDGDTARFAIRKSGDPNVTSFTKTFFKLDSIPELFNLYFDPDSVSNPDYLRMAMDCLSGVMPELMNVFGFPKSANPKDSVDLLVGTFTDEPNVVGRFNRLDRYIKNDGHELAHHNKGKPILYLSPELLNDSRRDGPGRICSVSAHEFQHLMNYEYKVLRPIPEKERYDLASVLKYRREREFLGLDEGISHLVEELSGGDQRVYARLLDFLNSQSEGSFSLELNYKSAADNSRARGANLALVYFALNQMGGGLDWPDPDTQKFLREVVTSSDIGYANLAKVIGSSTEKLFADFWANLDASLYSFEATKDLFPSEKVTDNITRGITIVDRDEPVEGWRQVGPASFHPLASDIPLLARAQAARLFPQSFARYRWIAPASKPTRPQNKIVLEGKAAPYLIVWSRVR